MPEPDLPVLTIEPSAVEAVRAAMPELPDVVRKRLEATYGISPYASRVLMSDEAAPAYFEALVEGGRDPILCANWLTSELFGRRAMHPRLNPLIRPNSDPFAMAPESHRRRALKHLGIHALTPGSPVGRLNSSGISLRESPVSPARLGVPDIPTPLF